ncbi:TPA: hypothetical protein ACSPZY_004430 [Aeromonas veronii]
MKKMKIAIAMLGLLGVVGSASAIDASQVFSWSGTVPAAPTSNSWVIAQPSGAPIGNGILTFTTNAANKGVLTGSTQLSFQVFKESTTTANTPDTAQPAASYSYKLVGLAVNRAGLSAEQTVNGYFAIQAANGVTTSTLVKNTAVTGASGTTVLNVIPTTVAAPDNQPMAGDSVDVHATIVVESATL